MKVKVWNKGPFDIDEEFLGKQIKIPQGEYIEMERSKAVKFQGQWAPFQREGNMEALNHRVIHLEADPEEDAARKDQPFRYTSSDGKKFRTVKGMENYESGLKPRKRAS